jgi:CubicO group peptidase (beta-lactamase class C family)
VKQSVAKNLSLRLKKAIIGVTPGVQIQVAQKGRLVLDIDVGDTYKYYDWASLTKIVSTTSLCMQLFEEEKLNLNRPVSDYLKWIGLTNSISEFTTHTAGMPWWFPLYKSITPNNSRLEKRYELIQEIRKLKSEKTGKAVYSDVDFWILGLLVEELYTAPLDSCFGLLADKMGLKSTFYHLDNKSIYSRDSYAPTEKCEWRGRIMQGEVHDENAWSLGGVAGHAGLFGPIDDLMTWALHLRKSIRGESKLWSKKTAATFLKRQLKFDVGDWAHGFMMPSPGSSSSGKYFSSESVGHTGFTGTSIWLDPRKDLIVAILSNRIHPTRRNEEFKKLRPKIHDWIVEELNV